MISGDIMPTSMDKDKIFIEIRHTVMFLLRERAQGREQFDIADLFRRDLEDEIVNNFDNMIKRQEYENIILKLFEQKKTEKKIHSTGPCSKRNRKAHQAVQNAVKKTNPEKAYFAIQS